LPAQKNNHDDPEFRDQVGRSELEDHRSCKIRSLSKDRTASATAAYEHDEDAAPNPQALASVFGELLGSIRLISPFETTACTTPESAKPRMSGQRISQNMAEAM
jgi:hypothetical protein